MIEEKVLFSKSCRSYRHDLIKDNLRNLQGLAAIFAVAKIAVLYLERDDELVFNIASLLS